MATESKKKDGGQRYNWDLISADYIQNSGMSLKKISVKYGVSFTTVKKHSKAEGWVAARKEHQKKLRQKVAQKVSTEKVNELTGIVTAADTIEKVILKALNDPDYFNKHILSRNLNEEEDTLSVLNVKAMKDMTKVLKDIEDIKRSINGIKREEQEIAAQRLQLERERFEFEKQKAEHSRPDKSAVIRIEGFEESWAE